MIAVVKISGHQYVVSKNDTVTVSKLPDASNDHFETTDVLLTEDNGNVTLGTPYVKDVTVVGKKSETVKGKKIHVERYRSKSRHRRAVGFRPEYTNITITDIKNSSSHEKSKREPKTT